MPVRDAIRISPRFEASLDEVREGLLELRLQGEADASVRHRLDRALGHAQTGECDVLVDLRRCEFLDSSALAALVFAEARLAKEGLRLVSYGGGSQLRRLFEVTGLDRKGMFAQDRGAAISVLTGG
jgi:anti-anti-sigma factor